MIAFGVYRMCRNQALAEELGAGSFSARLPLTQDPYAAEAKFT